jgi:hypothetical protein
MTPQPESASGCPSLPCGCGLCHPGLLRLVARPPCSVCGLLRMKKAHLVRSCARRRNPCLGGNGEASIRRSCVALSLVGALGLGTASAPASPTAWSTNCINVSMPIMTGSPARSIETLSLRRSLYRSARILGDAEAVSRRRPSRRLPRASASGHPRLSPGELAGVHRCSATRRCRLRFRSPDWGRVAGAWSSRPAARTRSSEGRLPLSR